MSEPTTVQAPTMPPQPQTIVIGGLGGMNGLGSSAVSGEKKSTAMRIFWTVLKWLGIIILIIALVSFLIGLADGICKSKAKNQDNKKGNNTSSTTSGPFCTAVNAIAKGFKTVGNHLEGIIIGYFLIAIAGAGARIAEAVSGGGSEEVPGGETTTTGEDTNAPDPEPDPPEPDPEPNDTDKPEPPEPEPGPVEIGLGNYSDGFERQSRKSSACPSMYSGSAAAALALHCAAVNAPNERPFIGPGSNASLISVSSLVPPSVVSNFGRSLALENAAWRARTAQQGLSSQKCS